MSVTALWQAVRIEAIKSGRITATELRIIYTLPDVTVLLQQFSQKLEVGPMVYWFMAPPCTRTAAHWTLSAAPESYLVFVHPVAVERCAAFHDAQLDQPPLDDSDDVLCSLDFALLVLELIDTRALMPLLIHSADLKIVHVCAELPHLCIGQKMHGQYNCAMTKQVVARMLQRAEQ
jgi:hypothetical protein